MKHWISKLLISLPILCAVNLAEATSSEYAEFYIPYQRVQSDYVCLDRQIMQGQFGIPLASMMHGIFADSRTLHQQGSGPNTYANINLLYQANAAIPWQLNFDTYHANGITDYSFTLNLAALNAANGSNVQGRQKTINTAKLAIISMAKTAELMHGVGKFRLWIRWDNLPSDSGLTGTPVLDGAPVPAGATTTSGWPFTSSSPLYNIYRNEMIHPNC